MRDDRGSLDSLRCLRIRPIGMSSIDMNEVPQLESWYRVVRHNITSMSAGRLVAALGYPAWRTALGGAGRSNVSVVEA